MSDFSILNNVGLEIFEFESNVSYCSWNANAMDVVVNLKREGNVASARRTALSHRRSPIRRRSGIAIVQAVRMKFRLKRSRKTCLPNSRILLLCFLQKLMECETGYASNLILSIRWTKDEESFQKARKIKAWEYSLPLATHSI
mmetsp:Transcript_45324/g.72890  ORF Transcript_45324/g.72890 Transcript_45324/m.72890 type:complete len:143 (+) Transcript_45324:1224-1652(+)